MRELKIILRFLVFILVLCLVAVWLAGFYFETDRAGYILRGMRGGIVVSMLMIGIVYDFKEVIIQGYSKKELS